MMIHCFGVDLDDRHDDVYLPVFYGPTLKAIRHNYDNQVLQYTSSGENRSACVVSICVTLNGEKRDKNTA